MPGDKAYPTVDEIFELLKRSSLPTVLVEGKNDIIFYRKIEEDLAEFDVSMLPAGNKGSVLELHKKISESPIGTVVFVVDNDLWIHGYLGSEIRPESVITTDGYSIENDLYSDGDLESLCSEEELKGFRLELDRFLHWYALSISRKMRNIDSTFRTHPNKVLDDAGFFHRETELHEGEEYPHELLSELSRNYKKLLRGKSLYALLARWLSRKKRPIKFSVMQLMEIGASRRGFNYKRLSSSISSAIIQKNNSAEGQ